MNDKFEIKHSNLSYLPLTILSTGFLIWEMIFKYEENIVTLKKNLILTYIFGGLILIALAILWYKSFDKSIKLIIDKNGIWSKKTGDIPWDNIYQINHTTDTSDEFYISYLIVFTRNRVKPFIINYSELKIDEKILFDTIKHHRDFNIYEIDYFNK